MKRLKPFVLGITLCALLSAGIAADESAPDEPTGQRYLQAVEALQNRDASTAARLLRELQTEGVQGADLEYNLGLAEMALGRPAEARVAFERVLAAQPRDLQARRNLRTVRSVLAQEVGEEAADLDVPGAFWWTEGELAILSFLLTFGVLAWMVGARRRQRLFEPHPDQQGRRLTPALVLLAGQSVLGALWLWSIPQTELAILTVDRAPLLESPGAESSSRRLPLGVRLKTGPKQGHLVQVQLGDGTIGWLREAQVRPLQLPKGFE